MHEQAVNPDQFLFAKETDIACTMMALCVLTGDLVASSALAPKEVDAALTTIETAATEIANWQSPAIATHFARRGGDSWQISIDAPELGLRAALYIAACLNRNDTAAVTRIAIARGTGTLSETGDLNAAHGPVFVASGRLLTNLSGHALMAHADGGAMHAATRLADYIASGWTQTQARTVAAFLQPNAPNRAEVAKSFGVTRQAVNQSLWSAGYPTIEEALNALETEAGK